MLFNNPAETCQVQCMPSKLDKKNYTYKEAVSRLNKLKTASYGYTTDCDIAGALKAEKITDSIMKKILQERLEIAEKFDDGWTDKASEENLNFNDSSNESEPVRESRKKRNATKKKKSITGQILEKDPWETFSEAIASTDLADSNNNDVERTAQKMTGNGKNKKANQENLADFNDTSDDSEAVRVSRRKQSGKPRESDTSITLSGAIGEKNNNNGQEGTSSHIRDTRDKHEEVESAANDLSPDTLFLLKVLKRLSVDLAANTAAINALHDAITLKLPSSVFTHRNTLEQLQEKYKIDLPFETLQQFQIFDQKLQEDPEMNEVLIISLKTLLDRNNNMTKSFSTILRKFFSRTMATGFTAQKKITNKILLKATNFGTCVRVALVNYHTLADGTPVNESLVWKCAGSAICNAKDWDGRRKRNE